MAPLQCNTCEARTLFPRLSLAGIKSLTLDDVNFSYLFLLFDWTLFGWIKIFPIHLQDWDRLQFIPVQAVIVGITSCIAVLRYETWNIE